MARANGKPRGRPPHKNSKAALPMPGDEQVGGWSQAQLIRMDHRFRARLLRAFESGKENRQAAAATYHAIRELPRQAIAAIIPSHVGGCHIPDTAYTACGADVRILR